MKPDQLFLTYKVHMGDLPPFAPRIKVGSIMEADQERDKRIARQTDHMSFSEFRVCKGSPRAVVKRYEEKPPTGMLLVSDETRIR